MMEKKDDIVAHISRFDFTRREKRTKLVLCMLSSRMIRGGLSLASGNQHAND